MMRVRTLFARSARAAAEYYGKYLAKDAHEIPGRWTGRQAPDLDLIGDVSVDDLSDVLAGLDPRTGDPLGRPLLDRITADGKTIPAVGGFDATFSAPKSLSIWWGLTGDERLAECHDIAVRAAASAIEKYGSTTRIRSNGRRMHVDTNGLTMAVFRQSTSRADDPQLHSHVIISSKVQTPDGRWYALDARVLKKHQRTFGGLYQSVLRAELTKRFGVAFDDIDNGLAEIAGVPVELIAQFSKRAADIDIEMDERIGAFIDEIGREPTRFERAAIEREVSRDTRAPKTGRSPADLRARWIAEAAATRHRRPITHRIDRSRRPQRTDTPPGERRVGPRRTRRAPLGLAPPRHPPHALRPHAAPTRPRRSELGNRARASGRHRPRRLHRPRPGRRHGPAPHV